MRFTSVLGYLSSRSSTRRRPSDCRLAVERLEDRCLLSANLINPISLQYASNPAVVAQPGHDIYWTTKHDQLMAMPKSGNTDLLMLGDSIMANWDFAGADVWHSNFSGLQRVNASIPGLRTQEVLWQLEDGEFTGLAPKVAMVMIGTGNIYKGQGAVEVTQGIMAVVEQLRIEFPETRVLLMGILPRADFNPATQLEITQINSLISRMGDGQNVKFVDIGGAFLQANGQVAPGMMIDALHPSEQGFRIWADAIQQPLNLFLTQADVSPAPVVTAAPAPVQLSDPIVAPVLAALDTPVTPTETPPPARVHDAQPSVDDLDWTAVLPLDANDLNLVTVAPEQAPASEDVAQVNPATALAAQDAGDKGVGRPDTNVSNVAAVANAAPGQIDETLLDKADAGLPSVVPGALWVDSDTEDDGSVSA
jgi:lysophospholipase L1-like esterase